jgi:hypothetical protein
MALARAVSNKVEAAYRRGDLYQRRRRMMDEWAKSCGTTVKITLGNVTSLVAPTGTA